MPKYDYKCKSCENNFFVECSINDKRDNVKCSSCQSDEVVRVYSGISFSHSGHSRSGTSYSPSPAYDESPVCSPSGEGRCHDCGKTPEEAIKAVAELNR